MELCTLIAVGLLAMSQRFCDRHGYQAPEKDISVRENAPRTLREAISQLAIQAGMTYTNLRGVVCAELLVQPDPENWTEEPNIRDEVFLHLSRCHWSKIYDISEAIYTALSTSWDDDLAETFSDRLNQFFREQGIGWHMERGNVEYRGSGSFTQSVKKGREALSSTDRSRAATELGEAVRDISRRPQPDITGAIHHAMAALEATARDVTGQPKPTLGKLVGSLKLRPPLDIAVEKLWGDASDGARHVREGPAPSIADAELIVGVSGAICAYLAEAHR